MLQKSVIFAELEAATDETTIRILQQKMDMANRMVGENVRSIESLSRIVTTTTDTALKQYCESKIAILQQEIDTILS